MKPHSIHVAFLLPANVVKGYHTSYGWMNSKYATMDANETRPGSRFLSIPSHISSALEYIRYGATNFSSGYYILNSTGANKYLI